MKSKKSDSTHSSSATVPKNDSDTRFRYLVNNMQVGVMLQDSEARIILSNNKALELLGLTEDQLLGKTSFDPDWNVIHEDGSPFPGNTHPVPVAIETRAAVLGVIMGVYRPFVKDRIWLLVDATPSFDSDGNVDQVVCTFIDISARKAAEDSLRNSEERHRTLYNKTPIMLHSIDNLGNMISVSDFWLNTLGYTREEVIGRKSTDFLTEASRKYAVETVLPEFLKTGYCNNVEYQFVKKNGEVIVALLSAISEKDKQGTVVRSLAVVTDITDRKRMEEGLRESEEIYRSILNASPDDITIADLDGRILLVSPSTLRLFGVESVKELVGHSLMEFIVKDERETAETILKSRINGQSIGSSEYRMLRPDGKTVEAEVNADVIRDADGQPAKLIFVVRDITERKLKEKALIQSKEYLSLAAVAGGIGIFDLNTGNHIPTWDDQMFRLYGVSKEENIGVVEAWQSRLHPDDFVRVNNEIELAFRGEKDFDTGFRVVWRDGSVHFIRAKAIVHRDAEGNALRMLGINYDITDQKLAEEALKASEELFRSSFEDHSAIKFIIDLDTGQIADANFAAEKYYGWSREDLKKMNISQINTLSEAEIRKAIDEARIRNKTTFEFKHRKADGTVRDVEVYSASIFSAAGKLYLHSIVIDITDRKLAEEALRKSEQRLKLTLELTHIGTWDWDVYSDTYIASPGYFTMLGYEPEYGNVSRQIWLDRVHPDDADIIRNSIKTIQTGVNKSYEYEARIKHANGSYRWIKVIGHVAQYDAENKPLRLIGVRIDVTEQKNNEERIQSMNYKLTELNLTKDKLFSVIAHDLKSPFHGLLGIAALMAEQSYEFTYDEINKFSKMMHVSAKNIYMLLENLLEWVKIQRNSTSFMPKTIPVRSIVNNAIDSIQQDADTKQIRVDKNITGHLNVFADENMVTSVLRNLLSNAVKFTKRNGQIVTAVKELPNGLIEFSVSDSGIGMSQKLIDKLFVLGEKVGSKGTENEPSTGLGLILCKEFVEKNGGTIRVESIDGKGSTFHFTVPTAAKD